MSSLTAVRVTFSVTLAAAILGACGQRTDVQPVQPAAFTVEVGAQAGSDTVAGTATARWQVMKFYPAVLTVNEGDTVTWVASTREPHTVTFVPDDEASPAFIIPEDQSQDARLIINPLAAFPAGDNTYDGSGYHNSGLMDQEPQNAQQYTLTFTKAGTYHYVCLLHGSDAAGTPPVGMAGTIVVKPSGTPRPQSPEQVQAAALAQINTDQAAALALEDDALAAVPEPVTTDGVTTHTVLTGFMSGPYELMRFVPTALTVQAGDRVTFTNPTPHTPHTATFLSGGEQPPFVLPEMQPAGPPLLVLNPEVLAPAGGPTYDGTGFVNSGVLTGQMEPGPDDYTLTFTSPGTHEYVCVVHSTLGMIGTVTVVQAD